MRRYWGQTAAADSTHEWYALSAVKHLSGQFPLGCSRILVLHNSVGRI